MLLHLARELARDLDRTHLGTEDTTERAFHHSGDHAFEIPEDGHLVLQALVGRLAQILRVQPLMLRNAAMYTRVTPGFFKDR